MRRLIIAILLGLTLAACSTSPPVPPIPHPPPSQPGDNGGPGTAPAGQALPFQAEANGLAVAGTLERTVLKAGSTLTVSVQVTNKGQQDVGVGGCDPVLWLDVMQGDGLVAGGKPARRNPCTMMAMVLRPGATNQYAASVVLPAKPGAYDLVVHATDNLATKPLPIQVTA